MSNYTPRNLKANIKSYADFSALKFNTEMDHDDVRDLFQEVLDGHQDIADVIYYHEAFEIVAGSDWNDYTENECDLEGCTNAMDALLKEANEIAARAFNELAGEVCDELAGDVLHLIDTALTEGYEGNITLCNGAVYGWAVHEREDAHGVCFYTNLEGEKGLTALEYPIGSGLHASVIWEKLN